MKTDLKVYLSLIHAVTFLTVSLPPGLSAKTDLFAFKTLCWADSRHSNQRPGNPEPSEPFHRFTDEAQGGSLIKRYANANAVD